MTKVFESKMQDSAASTTVLSTPAAGTLTGAGNTSASRVTGPGGLLPYALTFDGTDDYVNYSSISGSGNTVTFLMWMWRDGNQSAFDGLLRGKNDTGLNMKAATELGYTWNNTTATWNWASGIIIPNQQWVLVAVAIAPTEAKLYLISSGGTTVATNTTSHASISYLSAPKVANDAGVAGRFPKMRAAGAQIYDTTLSQATIEAIYTSTLAGTPAAPAFTSGNSASLPEETGLYQAVTLTGDDPMAVSITGGADSAAFDFNSTDRVLRLKAVPDYDNPTDSGSNNTYVVELTAENFMGSVQQTFTLTVTDTDKTGLLRPEYSAKSIYAHWDCSNAATFGGSFPANSGAIASLTEISPGSGPNLTGSGANTYLANQANGNGCIRLASGGGFTGAFGSSKSEFTIFCVLKPRQDAAVTPLFIDTTAGAHLLTGVSRTGGHTASGWAVNRDTNWCVYCRTRTADDAAAGGNLPGKGRLSFNGQCFAGSNGDAGAAIVSGNSVTLGGAIASQTDIAELIVMDGDVEYVEELQIRRYLMRKWGIPDHERRALVILCNSLSTGDETCYATEVVRDLYDENARDFELHNLAQTGGSVNTLASQATEIAALLADLSARGTKAVLCMWHGHNNNFWGAGIQSDLETIPWPWRSAGHRTISINISPVGTSLPGTSVSNWVANHAWHTSSGLTYFDLVADTTEVSWMVDHAAWIADSTHRKPDGLHLLTLGNQEVGDWMKPKILGQMQAFDGFVGSGMFSGRSLGVGRTFRGLIG